MKNNNSRRQTGERSIHTHTHTMSTDVQHYKQMYCFRGTSFILFFAGLKQFTGHTDHAV